MPYPEYQPDTDPYNRVWRYEYDQAVQENQELRDKIEQIRRVIYNTQRRDMIVEDYSITLQYILKMIEV